MANQFDYEWAFDEKTGRITGPRGVIIAHIVGGPKPESLKNGKLIAAAPELLELLEDSRRGIGFDWKQRRDALLMSLRAIMASNSAVQEGDREFLRAAMMKHFSNKLSMDEIGNLIYDVYPAESRPGK